MIKRLLLVLFINIVSFQIAYAAFGSSEAPKTTLEDLDDPVVSEKKKVLKTAIESLETHKKKLLERQEHYFNQLQQSSHAQMNLSATTSLSFAIRATDRKITELKKMLEALHRSSDVKLSDPQIPYYGNSLNKA